ncbi:MAG: hypothetical protein ACE5GQ_03640 [Nitrospinales bacterium]
MKTRTVLVFLLIAFIFPASASASAFAELLAFPGKNPAPARVEVISHSPEGIRIKVKNRLLRDVLRRIRNETGIKFKLHDNVINEKVTANLFAPNWKSAVRKLLADFSGLEIWGDSLSSSKILIMKSGKRNSTPKPVVKVARKTIKPAKIVVRAQPDAPPPPKAFGLLAAAAKNPFAQFTKKARP